MILTLKQSRKQWTQGFNMSFSSNMQKVAVRLLNKYGNDITIILRTSGVYNPTTGKTDYVSNNIDTRAFIGNYTHQELASDNVNSTDMKVLIALKFVIVKDDVLNIAGDEVQVLATRTVTTQNALIIQELQCRKVA